MDVLAWRKGVRLAIQVKATRSSCASEACLSIPAEERLLAEAKSQRATPTLALVSRNYVWFVRLLDRAVIGEGELRTVRYDYRGVA